MFSSSVELGVGCCCCSVLLLFSGDMDSLFSFIDKVVVDKDEVESGDTEQALVNN